jgi:DNA-3-methyladenine glycosylase
MGLSNFLSKKLKPLPRSFYLQDTVKAARDCLGKILLTETVEGITAGRIVEAEAYVGKTDKACHSYNYRRTPRTEIMFAQGGYAYIFMVHTHNQFCFSTNEVGEPDAVLVRAIEPLEGIDLMKKRREIEDPLKRLGNGPGITCKSLHITKMLYGHDLTLGNKIWLSDDGTSYDNKEIIATKRVGIDYAEESKDLPWRFYLKGSPFISKK